MAGTESFLYHDAVGNTKRQTTSDFKHQENFMNLRKQIYHIWIFYKDKHLDTDNEVHIGVPP